MKYKNADSDGKYQLQ